MTRTAKLWPVDAATTTSHVTPDAPSGPPIAPPAPPLTLPSQQRTRRLYEPAPAPTPLTHDAPSATPENDVAPPPAPSAPPPDESPVVVPLNPAPGPRALAACALTFVALFALVLTLRHSSNAVTHALPAAPSPAPPPPPTPVTAPAPPVLAPSLPAAPVARAPSPPAPRAAPTLRQRLTALSARCVAAESPAPRATVDYAYQLAPGGGLLRATPHVVITRGDPASATNITRCIEAGLTRPPFAPSPELRFTVRR